MLGVRALLSVFQWPRGALLLFHVIYVLLSSLPKILASYQLSTSQVLVLGDSRREWDQGCPCGASKSHQEDRP